MDNQDILRTQALPQGELQAKLRSDILGHFVMANSRAVATGILCLALTIIGGVGYYLWSKNHYKENLEVIYLFKADKLKSFEEKKLTWEQLHPAFDELQKKVGHHAGLYPITATVVSSLLEQQQIAAAQTLLEQQMDIFRQDQDIYYLMGHQLSALYEDDGKFENAIGLLDKLVGLKTKFINAKLYFDLGRLNKKIGRADKAKIHFQYVVDSFPSDPLAKIAKIYLKQL